MKAMTKAGAILRGFCKVSCLGAPVYLFFLLPLPAIASMPFQFAEAPQPLEIRSAVESFAGDASRVSPASACGKVLPDDIQNPFMPLTKPLTAGDYELVGCWAGQLEGKRFVLAEYFSPYAGGGLAIKYDGRVVGRLASGSGKPTIVRFVGHFACDMEQAGAHYLAVNLMTGAVMDDRRAQEICPPQGMPRYVLGLRNRRIPIGDSGN